MARSFERLSSGLRINRAADDAAGLAISEGFRAEIRSLQQAQRNSLDAISLVQIAEGAMEETGNILIRLRELGIQAANGTLGSSERASLNSEFQDLLDEIDRIADVTEFNGIRILADVTASVTFQVGVNGTSSDTITVSGVAATASALGVTNLTVSTQALARATLSTLDSAIGVIASLRATFGTTQNRLESTIRSIATAVENLSAAESRIRDVDVALETAELTRNQILQQAGVSVLSQANISTQVALALLN